MNIQPPPEESFHVSGKPMTKGSTKSFINPKTGRLVTQSTNKLLKDWEALIAREYRSKIGIMHTGPVKVSLVFKFVRPLSHIKKGPNQSIKLKYWAPLYPTSRACGDIDKLIRAVLDALTGKAYADDSQVINISAFKTYTYAGAEGVDIWVYNE